MSKNQLKLTAEDKRRNRKLLDERDKLLKVIPHGHQLVGWNSLDDFTTICDGMECRWNKPQAKLLRALASHPLHGEVWGER